MLLPTTGKPSPTTLRRHSAFRVPRSAFFFAVSALFAALSLLLSGAQAQAPQFANPAFKSLWDRTDGLVASGGVQRPWIWGPAPGTSLTEPFTGLPGNSHLVQFFDKGRMELNDPGADPNDPFFVTNGRLAIELISGQAQTGLDSFVNLGTAQIDLASDSDDPTAPTYGSFNGVSNLPGTGDTRRATDSTGTVVRTAIDRQGNTQPWPTDHADYGVQYAHYEETTGHNIPDVFWDYLNQQTTIIQAGEVVTGPLFYPWFAVTGYPISEPFWSYVKVEGKYTDVLSQAYERRVLTYVPHLPTPFKVQMGNIGQHYYEWRYANPGTPIPTPRPGATPTSPGLPTKADVTIDGISYKQSVGDLNGTYCIIDNRGDTPVSLTNWRLDSPKWSIVDTYRFPDGIVLAPHASIKVHSGVGQTTSTDVYMGRSTVMWDHQDYDYAVLYDNYGRQVADFFPAGDVGPPPTSPPSVPTVTTAPGKPSATTEPGKPTVTLQPGAPTNTRIPVPSAVSTSPTGDFSPTPTLRPSGSSTASPTPNRSVTATPTTSGAATATPTTAAGCTNLITNGDFENLDDHWLSSTNSDLEIINGIFPYTGTYGATFGINNNEDDKLWQVVTIPANVTRADLDYWHYMLSEDTSGQDHDYLYAEVRTESGDLLGTLETFTNTGTQSEWAHITRSVLAYKGRTVRIQFRATTDASLETDFAADDVALTACP